MAAQYTIIGVGCRCCCHFGTLSFVNWTNMQQKCSDLNMRCAHIVRRDCNQIEYQAVSHLLIIDYFVHSLLTHPINLSSGTFIIFHISDQFTSCVWEQLNSLSIYLSLTVCMCSVSKQCCTEEWRRYIFRWGCDAAAASVPLAHTIKTRCNRFPLKSRTRHIL